VKQLELSNKHINNVLTDMTLTKILTIKMVIFSN